MHKFNVYEKRYDVLSVVTEEVIKSIAKLGKLLFFFFFYNWIFQWRSSVGDLDGILKALICVKYSALLPRVQEGC